MSITFYYGSGSPFSWYVWLVLVHKQLPYALKLLSLQNGEQKTPEYLGIHHRGKVPALQDQDKAFLESVAIVEYLEDQYPQLPVFPKSPAARAKTRQLVLEAHGYFYPPLRRLMEKTLMRASNLPANDEAAIEAALGELSHELNYIEEAIAGDFICGTEVTAADFAWYPLLALIKRISLKFPQVALALPFGIKTKALMAHIEQLPYFDSTYPPHWR